MVFIGQKINDFSLDAFQDEEIKKIKFSSYKGKWLIVFFYPADFTFVCPTELEELANSYAEFKKVGAEILSVSTDTAYVHKAWHDTSPAIKKITFPMVADPAGKLSKEFGVYLEDEGLALRGTFIIDPDGILRACEVNDNSFGRSAKELLRKLNAAKFVREHTGMVCQAAWEPGMEAMKAELDLVGKI
jgi:NADH-dependent peroxiredoxin subunit C